VIGQAVIVGDEFGEGQRWTAIWNLLFFVFVLIVIVIVVVLVVRSVRAGRRSCPWCAQSIKVQAKVCRFCGRDVPPIEA
jgi:hypothetical protein